MNNKNFPMCLPVHNCVVKVQYAYEHEILNRTFKDLGGVTGFELFKISKQDGSKYYDLSSTVPVPYSEIGSITPKQFQDYARIHIKEISKLKGITNGDK